MSMKVQFFPTQKPQDFEWFQCLVCNREGHTTPSFKRSTELAHHLATWHGWPLLRALKLGHDLERDKAEFERSELERASVGLRPRISIPELDWTL
jgi:hypothetical protein